MELNEMEELWKKHDIKLESSIRLNDSLLRRLNFDKAVDEFKKFVDFSILGRNLAFIYFLISLGSSVAVLSDLKYSIPGLFGALCMLWSFLYHLGPTSKVRKIDFNTMSVVELQKTINTFKIRTISVSKYDFVVVAIWLLTLGPIKFRSYDKDVYSDPGAVTYYLLISSAVLIAVFFFSKIIFEKFFLKKLNRAETQLNEILEFEKQVS